MFKIMITDMLAMAKKKITLFLLCTVFILYAVAHIRLARGTITILLFVFLYLFTQEMPLRICKGMFVCAAGKRERMRYLVQQLMVKILFSFVLLIAVLLIGTQGIFSGRSIMMQLMQLVLWFFTILNMNLKIGIGIRGARKQNAEGYAIYSKAEMAVNIYWFCFILLQNVLFYTCILLGINIGDTILGILAAVMLLGNGYFAVRYFQPVLSEAMSYENVYRQEPETGYIQYDSVTVFYKAGYGYEYEYSYKDRL